MRISTRLVFLLLAVCSLGSAGLLLARSSPEHVSGDGSLTVSAAAAIHPPRPIAESSTGYGWPVNGPITSRFDAEHPLGIDIGLSQTPNAPIFVVADGTVSFAGGKECCSYGLYVIVDHPDGLKTVYAHLSRIDVVEGQQVGRGDRLGLAGETGYSTSEHLHFEVRRDRERLDPMQWLPQTCRRLQGKVEREFSYLDTQECHAGAAADWLP